MASETDAGVICNPVIIALVTSIEAVLLLIPSLAAEMVVVPTPTPVSNAGVVTVAILVSTGSQATVLVTSAVVLSL